MQQMQQNTQTLMQLPCHCSHAAVSHCKSKATCSLPFHSHAGQAHEPPELQPQRAAAGEHQVGSGTTLTLHDTSQHGCFSIQAGAF